MNDVEILPEVTELLRGVFANFMYLNRYNPDNTEFVLIRTNSKSVSKTEKDENGEPLVKYYYMFKLIPKRAKNTDFVMVDGYKYVVLHRTIKKVYVGKDQNGVHNVIRAVIVVDGKEFDYQVFIEIQN